MGCWHGYLSGARCRLAYGPADATATHCLLLQCSVKSRLVLPFWYRLTLVVLEKGPLNGCVCVCVNTRLGVRLRFRKWTTVNGSREQFYPYLETCLNTNKHVIRTVNVRCTGDNLVLNMPTHQSSTEGDKVASRATDYNKDTQSCTGAGDEHPWWAVDLSAKYDVRHVSITASSAASTHRIELAVGLFIVSSPTFAVVTLGHGPGHFIFR